MWKYTVETEGLQMIIWRMRISCWTTKTTNIPSNRPMYHLLLFHGNNSDRKSHQYYVIRIFPVLFNSTEEFPRSSLWLGLRQINLPFKVCKSVHRRTFQINQPTRCNNFSSLLLDVYSYVQLNMFRVSSRPLSGAQQLQ